MASQPKKIFVDKNESAADLIQRILTSREKNIVIVIPKDTVLKKSLKNFRLLKQETAAAEKNIVIESVDEEVLAFAGASAIGASHPLFTNSGHRMSDIVPRSSERKLKKEEVRKAYEEHITEEEPEEKSPGRKGMKILESFRERDEEEHFFRDESPRERRSGENSRLRRFFGSKFGKATMGIFICAVVAFMILGHFAKATISINLKHNKFSYDNPVVASPQITAINVDKNQIPGEIFTNQKNFTQLFPATGKSDSSTKAKGIMTVWNAYNSSPQKLVATTRFETPDGKIFRLDKTITVPGALVENGKITPSSIDATVTADAAGSNSNVSAIPKLSIPGFKGGPRASGFYGELKNGAGGGGTGRTFMATQDDIAQAKTKTQNILAADLQSLTIASLPAGFVIPAGAARVSDPKISVNSNTDSNGNFSVFAEAKIQAIGFRTSDLAAILLDHANQNSPYEQDFAQLTTNYAQANPDFAHGTLTFEVQAQGDLMPNFSSSTFVGTVAGESESQARIAVLGLPGLIDAKISLWPIWETAIPKDKSRIVVQVQ